MEPAYGSYEYLMREVGAILGYGRDYDSWSHEKRGVANAVVQRGVRDFYNPVPLEGEKYAHAWSFLSPVRQLTTVADTWKYDLPKDFAMLDGPITFEIDQDVITTDIRIVSEYEIRRKQIDSDTTGVPTMAAVVPGDVPGRWKLFFWVTPDDAYTLEYRCQLNPPDLSVEDPMPYGGVEHVRTVLESCLKCAEEEKSVRGGVHAEQFMQRLAASVSHDRKVVCPRVMKRAQGWGTQRHYGEELYIMPPVEYDGTEWD